jgi:subtilisin family serine protease
VLYSRLFDMTQGNTTLKQDLGMTRTYLIEASDEVNPEALRRDLTALGAVELCIHNQRLEFDNVPNDYDGQRQWNLAKIGMEKFWNEFANRPISAEVALAILDTFVDTNHEDLRANIVAEQDCTDTEFDRQNNMYVCHPPDLRRKGTTPNEHGTYVAGIAGAVSNNGVGIAGVAQNCKLMPLKVGDDFAKFDYVFRAIEQAVDQKYLGNYGAVVINMSLSSALTALGQDLQERVQILEVFRRWVRYAYRSNVPIVASMGNLNWDIPHVPAFYDETIAVGATDQNGNRWVSGTFGSNYGNWIDLVAPGGGVWSTIPGGYGFKSGTSAAAPHVTGVLGLILAQNPNYTVDALRSLLMEMADKNIPNYDPNLHGAGLVVADLPPCDSPGQHIAVEPAEHDFGEVLIGESVTIPVTITNPCVRGVDIQTVQLIPVEPYFGEFNLNDQCS